ncbi:hypothetical protein AUC68_02170 [Methyloceanibacter methanicus]|uniref:Uncharacterized protein n=1 Tax=Methyloceanibacter methanicus TaxID=1774968 RepID=A0A1E3W2A9_9HYPH|nr:hypothetical protein [Methyloceanibacter methanicus]ODR99947.1 hypothetical protein AUC68_02170 [Methyloceanibacter methanicus]
MSDGGRLLWIVGVFAAATVGLLAGIWIGGEIESDIFWDVIAETNLPAECLEAFEAAANRVADSYQGSGTVPAAD